MQFTYRLFSACPSLPASLSPHSVITNPHIALMMAVRLLQLFRPTGGKPNFSYPLSEKSNFCCLGKAQEFVRPKPNFAGHRDAPGKRGRNGVPYIRVCCPLGRGAVQFGRCVPTFRANR